MTTNIKSESITCHIWNTTLLLTEKSSVKLALKGKKKKKPVKCQQVFQEHSLIMRSKFGDQLMDHKCKEL